MIEPVAVAIFGNMAVDEPDLLPFDQRIAFRDRPFARSKRLHFGAFKLDAGLEALLDEILEARTPVLGDDLGLVEFLNWWSLGQWALRSIPHEQAHRPPLLSTRRTAPSLASAAPEKSRAAPSQGH